MVLSILGMTSAFLFALLTNRAYIADWQTPFPLDTIFDSPNIHFCTFKDFEVLCREKNIKVIHREVVNEQSAQWLKDVSPNLFGETAIYHLSK